MKKTMLKQQSRITRVAAAISAAAMGLSLTACGQTTAGEVASAQNTASGSAASVTETTSATETAASTAETTAAETAASTAETTAAETAASTAETTAAETADAGVDPFYAVTEPITIEFWHNMSEEDHVRKVTDAFNASQEYITVEPVYIGGYPVIKEQIAAAQAARDGLPALSTINYPQVITYADSGVAEPLDGYVSAYDYDLNVFYKGFTDPVTVDGQLYAFPYGPSATYIFYNRDLLKEGGLDHYPETWAELKEVAPAFHEATGKPLLSLWGSSTGFNTINSFLIQTGVDPLGDGTTARVDDPAIVQWVRDVKELVDNGGAEWIDTGNNTETDLKTKFLAGEVASFPYSNTYYDLVLKDAGFDVGLALYPENANRNVTTAGATLFIPALNDQAVKNAAFQFLTFITNDENAKQFALDSAYLPTRRTILEDEASVAAFTALYPDDQVIFSHMDDIIPKNSSPYFTPALTEIVEELTQIFNNGADIDETIAKTTENVNYILSGN